VSVQATVTFKEAVRFEAVADSGHTLIIDGPEAAGGQNAGFRPMELMLLGMAGCMSLDVVLILRRMRKQVTSYTVHVTAERAEDPPRVYTEARLEHLIGGPGLDAASVQRAIELAEGTYCSGTAMFAKTAKVTNNFRLLAG
jgi:putative redox protein